MIPYVLCIVAELSFKVKTLHTEIFQEVWMKALFGVFDKYETPINLSVEFFAGFIAQKFPPRLRHEVVYWITARHM